MSVVLPVRNGAPVITETLRSLQSQSMQDFEIVVIDDGSTDDTARILDSFDDDRLIRKRHATSRGLSAALNAGLDAARGPLVARLDHDDLAHPDRLRRQLVAFEKAPETGIVFSACDVIDASGIHIGVRTPPRRQAGLMLALLFSNCVTHSTAMYRRELVTEAGGYRAEWFPDEDYDLWLRLMWRTNVEVLPQVLVAHRVWAGSVTARHRAVMDAKSRALAEGTLLDVVGSKPRPEVIDALGGGPRIGPAQFQEAADALDGAAAAVRAGCRRLGLDDDGLRATAAMMLRRSGVLGARRHPAVTNLARLARSDLRLAVTVARQSARLPRKW